MIHMLPSPSSYTIVLLVFFSKSPTSAPGTVLSRACPEVRTRGFDAGCLQALASGLGLPAWQWDQPALESKGAGPEAITLDDLRPNGRSFSQLHYLIGLGLVADDLS